jgi:hypothetical protein
VYAVPTGRRADGRQGEAAGARSGSSLGAGTVAREVMSVIPRSPGRSSSATPSTKAKTPIAAVVAAWRADLATGHGRLVPRLPGGVVRAGDRPGAADGAGAVDDHATLRSASPTRLSSPTAATSPPSAREHRGARHHPLAPFPLRSSPLTARRDSHSNDHSVTSFDK